MTASSFAEDDHTKHQRLVGQLRRAGGPYNERLATGLENCTPDRRCRSGACIHCGRELQRAVFSLINTEIREPARRSCRGRMTAVSIIPPWATIPPNALSADICWRFITQIASTIAELRLTPSITGFDISFNEDAEGEYADHWALHVHLVLLDWLSKAHEERAKTAFPTSWSVKRPVKFQRLDDADNGLLYAVKPDRIRKVSYRDDSKVHLGRDPHRNTRRKLLRPEQAVALAQVEHELGLINRVFATGIDQNAIRMALKGFYWPQDGP